MNKATASSQPSRAKTKKSRQHDDLELDIASLFSELSRLYTKTTLLTEILKNRRHDQSSGDSFEVEVMLKNALRILRDVMSHLPS